MIRSWSFHCSSEQHQQHKHRVDVCADDVVQKNDKVSPTKPSNSGNQKSSKYQFISVESYEEKTSKQNTMLNDKMHYNSNIAYHFLPL
ncbi:unnamed protein product [Schistosoma curassoni]|uniref:Ovule protein n=1 Tax=Schistosoma curassoni TaxID=6186 RepID=A0A183KNA7_9TREM|nr:unnamed protein product [Schistosoma curassoni]